MVKDTLMLSKTYHPEDDWSDDSPSVKKERVKRRKPSKKELLDALEEHNDGYINDQADEVDRGE